MSNGNKLLIKEQKANSKMTFKVLYNNAFGIKVKFDTFRYTQTVCNLEDVDQC